MNVWKEYWPLLKAALMLGSLILTVGMIAIMAPRQYANALAAAIVIPCGLYITFYIVRATARILFGAGK